VWDCCPNLRHGSVRPAPRQVGEMAPSARQRAKPHRAAPSGAPPSTRPGSLRPRVRRQRPKLARPARDPKPVGQARLRQPDGVAQGQHALAERIVALTIGESLHGRPPFLASDQPSAPWRKRWEGRCHLPHADFLGPGCILSLGDAPSCTFTPFCGGMESKAKCSIHPTF
jgi:hypothetical protein